jgi:hypothetical protein
MRNIIPIFRQNQYKKELAETDKTIKSLKGQLHGLEALICTVTPREKTAFASQLAFGR